MDKQFADKIMTFNRSIAFNNGIPVCTATVLNRTTAAPVDDFFRFGRQV
ncbi:MAG: hypothetical protein PVI06_15300 [Desulfobacterales bacterium]|jgi:hypothetical protein